MKAYLINMHLLVPRSRSSAKVKVKYKGYISQKMAVSGAFVFHKHILFFLVFNYFIEQTSFGVIINLLFGFTFFHCLITDKKGRKYCEKIMHVSSMPVFRWLSIEVRKEKWLYFKSMCEYNTILSAYSLYRYLG